ncbi:MAG: penicillin-binding protein activator LpoB, partial [Burkholderiales bacterium]|nr:penicillin-binding protein activator LpoB [Burkholderiales bacterium]
MTSSSFSPLRLSTAVVLAATLAVAACGGPKTKYGDAGSVETVTNQFGSTDLQMLAEQMSQSMLSEAPVISSGNLPIVTVQEVKNKTSEYIDTRAITNRMRATLQKSRKVRFATDQADMQKQIDEIQRQQSEYYDQNKSTEVGKMVGAGFRVTGEITSIVKENKKVKDVYYQLFLSMTNIQSGIEEWS